MQANVKFTNKIRTNNEDHRCNYVTAEWNKNKSENSAKPGYARTFETL